MNWRGASRLRGRGRRRRSRPEAAGLGIGGSMTPSGRTASRWFMRGGPSGRVASRCAAGLVGWTSRGCGTRCGSCCGQTGSAAAATRTPTACCASTGPKAPTSGQLTQTECDDVALAPERPTPQDAGVEDSSPRPQPRARCNNQLSPPSCGPESSTCRIEHKFDPIVMLRDRPGPPPEWGSLLTGALHRHVRTSCSWGPSSVAGGARVSSTFDQVHPVLSCVASMESR